MADADVETCEAWDAMETAGLFLMGERSGVWSLRRC